MSQEVPSNYISAAAMLQRVVIPPGCEAGLLANLTLFLRHADIVVGADDAETDPAELLRP